MSQPYYSQTWRLRASSPMPKQAAGGCSGSNFVIQSFMAERTTIEVYTCIGPGKIPNSNEFVGQGGDYVSASFTQLPLKGDPKFSGKIVKDLVIVPESETNIIYG